LSPAERPATEDLKMTLARVLPYWNQTILPAMQSGQRVLIAAHGNSLRALVKHLDNLSEAEVLQLNIPTGVPLVYEFDAQLKPIKHYYLGNPEEIAAAMEAVAAQGSKKK
jgi:2,3-bisphosphoglycerate-dependent phosphoglycerate mutase